MESGTGDGSCYICDETQGKRGANEISSCLFDWLVSLDIRNKYEIIGLFCDNCAGQHKNWILF